MTIPVSNVETTQTFNSWLATTNILARIASQNAVTADASSNGSLTTGNGYVNGHFGADYLYAASGIVGGRPGTNNSILMLSNSAFRYNTSNLVTVTANSTNTVVTLQPNTVIISPTVSTRITGPLLNVNSDSVSMTTNSAAIVANNTTITGNVAFKSNTTFNALTITSAAGVPTIAVNTTSTAFTGNVTINSQLTAVANASFSNSITVANTVASNLVVASTVNTATLNVSANANLTGLNATNQANLAGGAVISGPLNVTGNVTVNTNTISVTANSTTFANNVTVVGLANVGSLFSVGSANVAGNVRVSGDLIVNGNFLYSGTTVGDLLPNANSTLNLGSPSLYWAAGYISTLNSTNVVVSNVATLNTVTVANTLGVTRAATFSNTVSVAGNASFTNTIAVTGNATFSNAVTVAGNTTLNNALLLAAAAAVSTNTYTFTNNAMAVIDSFATTSFRSVEYTIQTSDTTAPANSHQITKIILVHDGTQAQLTEYATITTNTSMGVFNAAISAETLSLRLTPVSNNVTVKLTRTAITV